MKSQKGFSLLELMVVIAIIGILIAIMATHSNTRKRAQERFQAKLFQYALSEEINSVFASLNNCTATLVGKDLNIDGVDIDKLKIPSGDLYEIPSANDDEFKKRYKGRNGEPVLEIKSMKVFKGPSTRDGSVSIARIDYELENKLRLEKGTESYSYTVEVNTNDSGEIQKCVYGELAKLREPCPALLEQSENEKYCVYIPDSTSVSVGKAGPFLFGAREDWTGAYAGEEGKRLKNTIVGFGAAPYVSHITENLTVVGYQAALELNKRGEVIGEQVENALLQDGVYLGYRVARGTASRSVAYPKGAVVIGANVGVDLVGTSGEVLVKDPDFDRESGLIAIGVEDSENLENAQICSKTAMAMTCIQSKSPDTGHGNINRSIRIGAGKPDKFGDPNNGYFPKSIHIGYESAKGAEELGDNIYLGFASGAYAKKSKHNTYIGGFSGFQIEGEKNVTIGTVHGGASLGDGGYKSDDENFPPSNNQISKLKRSVVVGELKDPRSFRFDIKDSVIVGFNESGLRGLGANTTEKNKLSRSVLIGHDIGKNLSNLNFLTDSVCIGHDSCQREPSGYSNLDPHRVQGTVAIGVRAAKSAVSGGVFIGYEAGYTGSEATPLGSGHFLYEEAVSVDDENDDSFAPHLVQFSDWIYMKDSQIFFNAKKVGIYTKHERFMVAKEDLSNSLSSIECQEAEGSTCPSPTPKFEDYFYEFAELPPSDIRLKTGIEDFKEGLKKLLALKGYTFFWKSSPKGQRQVGFMAQEVESILPNVVDEVGGVLRFQYDKLAPLLLSAFKELVTSTLSKFQKLKQKVKELLNEKLFTSRENKVNEISLKLQAQKKTLSNMKNLWEDKINVLEKRRKVLKLQSQKLQARLKTLESKEGSL